MGGQKTERNLKIHLIAAVLAIILGLYLGLPSAKWCLVAFAIGFMPFAELFNNAIERLAMKSGTAIEVLLSKL